MMEYNISQSLQWPADIAREICYIILAMKENIDKHIKPIRLKELPAVMREQLKEARHSRG